MPGRPDRGIEGMEEGDAGEQGRDGAECGGLTIAMLYGEGEETHGRPGARVRLTFRGMAGRYGSSAGEGRAWGATQNGLY